MREDALLAAGDEEALTVRAFARAARGRGHVLGFTGTDPERAGLRHRLLDRAAAEGWQVTAARALPGRDRVTHDVLRQLLAHHDRVPPAEGPGRLLRDLAAGTFHGVGDLAFALQWWWDAAAAERPLLVLVDGAEHADHASAAVLAAVVPLITSSRCLVVLVGADLRDVPVPLRRGPGRSGRSLVHPVLDAREDRTTTPTVPTAPPELPAGGLPLAVLAGCEVLGADASAASLADLLDRDVEEVAEAAEDLLADGLLCRIRETLFTEPPAAGADALARYDADQQEVWWRRATGAAVEHELAPSVVAFRAARVALDHDDALRQLLRSPAQTALARGDRASAELLARRALAEHPEGGARSRWLTLLATAVQVEHAEEAVQALDAAAELADTPVAAATLKARAADVLIDHGRSGEAARRYAETLESVRGTDGWPRVASQMLVAGFVGSSVALDMSSWRPEDLIDAEGSETLPAALLLVRQSREAARVREYAGADPDLAGDLAHPVRASLLFLRIGLRTWTSDHLDAERLYGRAMELTRARGTRGQYVVAASSRGLVRTRMGRISEALVDLDEALRGGQVTWQAQRSFALASRAECWLARGDLHEASRHRPELAELLGHGGMAGAVAANALADLATAGDDHDEASRLYEQAGQLLRGGTDNPTLVPWRAGAAVAAVRGHRFAEAQRLAEENLELARRFGAPAPLAHALRTSVAVTARLDARDLLTEACEVLEGVAADRIRAQVQIDLASMLLLAHEEADTRRALELVREAETYANAEELYPLQQRVAAVLGRMGKSPRRVGPRPEVQLSGRERRIASLVRDGLTDREIAQRLFTTRQSVTEVLTDLYRKLGIRSRKRLVELLDV